MGEAASSGLLLPTSPKTSLMEKRGGGSSSSGRMAPSLAMPVATPATLFVPGFKGDGCVPQMLQTRVEGLSSLMPREWGTH